MFRKNFFFFLKGAGTEIFKKKKVYNLTSKRETSEREGDVLGASFVKHSMGLLLMQVLPR